MGIDAFEEKVTELLEKEFDTVNTQLQELITEFILNLYPQNEVLSTIYISFLRSSVLNNTPWYRIDFYNQLDRQDMRNYHCYWDIESVKNMLNRCFPPVDESAPSNRVLKEKLKQESGKMESVELFHELLGEKMRLTFSLSSECQNKRLAISMGTRVFFGEYMGDVDRVK